MPSAKSVLYFVTEDWYFCSHRLALARAAKEAGYRVTVVTRVNVHGEQIRNAGLNLIVLNLSRRGLNPIREMLVIMRLIQIYRSERPDVVHHVAIKPVIYGSIAAWVARTSWTVNAIAGLGFLFSTTSPQARAMRLFVRSALRVLLSRRNSCVIVQNPDDFAILNREWAIPQTRMHLIRGSGVDMRTYAPGAEPSGPVLVVLAARMLWAKGVGEFVAAAKKIRSEGSDARFVLVGDTDAENPTAIPEGQLRAWHEEGAVEWWGLRSNMPEVFSQAHIVCLPTSYGEGVPKVLIEAAASGLPIVATDSPGCREVVEHGETGLLVTTNDVEALADALRQLIMSGELRRQFGRKGREMVEHAFSIERVIEQTLRTYTPE